MKFNILSILLLSPALLLSPLMHADFKHLPENESRIDSPDSKPKIKQDYSDPIHFMTDFLDMSKKPEKSLKYWVLQLLLLLKNNDKLADFRHEIRKIALAKDLDIDERHLRITRAFTNAYLEQKFPPELAKFVRDKGLKYVSKVLKDRAAKITEDRTSEPTKRVSKDSIATAPAA